MVETQEIRYATKADSVNLVAASGLNLEHAREHELEGVPDRWRLYRVVN